MNATQSTKGDTKMQRKLPNGSRILALAALLAALSVGGCGTPQEETPQEEPSTPSTGVATLTWEAPTTNIDGTQLTNLAGFKIYYGTTSPLSGANSQVIDVGNTTTYTVSGLTSGTTFFAVTAYDIASSESPYSNEGSKTIP